jgi:hypothetical protein
MKNVVQVIKFGAKIAVAAAAVVLAVGVMKGTAYADDETNPTSGSDEGIAWEYDSGTHTLTINPSPTAGASSGTMSSYKSDPVTGGEGAPGWSVWYSEVTDIVIGDGVKNITTNAFAGTSSSKKELNSVTIGTDVEKIESGAFSFANIKKLTVNSTAIDGTSSKDIAATAFLSLNDSSQIYLDVQEVDTTNTYVKSYFEGFKEGTSNSVTVGNVTASVIASNVEINPFEIIFVDRNTLDSNNEDVQYKRDGKDWASATIDKNNATVVAGLWNVFDALKAADYDVNNRIKLFDIRRSNSYATETAQIKIPVPSEWKDNASTIEVLTYTNDGTAKIEKVETVLIEDGYIIFTPEHYSPYALYYTYGLTTGDEPIVTDPVTNDEVTVDIDADYFNYYAYQVGTNSADIKIAGTDDSSGSAITNAFSAFYSANQVNNSGYKIDADHLKAFNVTAKVNGTETSDKIDSLSIWVPVPAAWADKVDKLLILTVTDGKIEVVQKLDVRTNNGSVELRFVPPHFSPYAIYYADAEVTTTTAATTTVAATTTAAATTKATTTAAATTSKTVSGGANVSGGSGTYDYTPGTGVKDFMWIAVPVAVLLMGVGVVVLAMRKRKNLDE